MTKETEKEEFPVKMLHDHVLIQVKKHMRTKGGIELPPSMQDATRVATVGWAVATGPEVENTDVGDFVFYKEFVGHALDHPILDTEHVYLVVSEKDLLGTIGEEVAREFDEMDLFALNFNK